MSELQSLSNEELLGLYVSSPKANSLQSMSDADLLAAHKSQTSTLGKALEPITSYPSTYSQMNREARDTMGHGYDQTSQALSEPHSAAGAAKFVKGVGNMALGGVGYVASPINAALRTVIGKPLEENTGIPKEYSEFGAGLALPGVGMTRAPNLARAVTAEKAAPTIAEIKGASRAGYNSPEVTALEVEPQSLVGLSQKVKGTLTEMGLDETVAEKTWRILDKAEKAPDGSVVTGKNLDSLRKTLGHAAQSIDGSERAAAGTAIRAVDDYLESIPRADVLAGDAAATSTTFAEARGNWSAAKHAETIDKKTVQAELRASAANSGQNVSNTVRQRLADILINDKQRRGFTPEALELMETIVRGTPTQNALRMAGNALGGGGGIGATATGVTGALTTPGGIGAVAPVIGIGLKKLGNAITMRQVEQLSEMIRAGSPLGQRMSRPLENWSTATQKFSDNPSARTFAMVNIASRNLSNNLKDAGIAVSPEDLLRSLQGPSRSGAEE